MNDIYLKMTEDYLLKEKVNSPRGCPCSPGKRQEVTPVLQATTSPDHQSVRNKEVKFICICSLGPRFSVRIREGPYYRGFLKKTCENFVGT